MSVEEMARRLEKHLAGCFTHLFTDIPAEDKEDMRRRYALEIAEKWTRTGKPDNPEAYATTCYRHALCRALGTVLRDRGAQNRLVEQARRDTRIQVERERRRLEREDRLTTLEGFARMAQRQPHEFLLDGLHPEPAAVAQWKWTPKDGDVPTFDDLVEVFYPGLRDGPDHLNLRQVLVRRVDAVKHAYHTEQPYFEEDEPYRNFLRDREGKPEHLGAWHRHEDLRETGSAGRFKGLLDVAKIVEYPLWFTAKNDAARRKSLRKRTLKGIRASVEVYRSGRDGGSPPMNDEAAAREELRRRAKQARDEGKFLLRELEEDDPVFRLTAADGMAHLGPAADTDLRLTWATALRRRMERESDPEVRMAAAAALVALGCPDSTEAAVREALLQGLAAPEVEVRARAAASLAWLPMAFARDSEVRSRLSQSLEDAEEDPTVRGDALTALSPFVPQDEKLQGLMLRLATDDPDESVRLRAGAHLSRAPWWEQIARLTNLSVDKVLRGVPDRVLAVERQEGAEEVNPVVERGEPVEVPVVTQGGEEASFQALLRRYQNGRQELLVATRQDRLAGKLALVVATPTVADEDPCLRFVWLVEDAGLYYGYVNLPRRASLAEWSMPPRLLVFDDDDEIARSLPDMSDELADSLEIMEALYPEHAPVARTWMEKNFP